MVSGVGGLEVVRATCGQEGTAPRTGLGPYRQVDRPELTRSLQSEGAGTGPSAEPAPLLPAPGPPRLQNGEREVFVVSAPIRGVLLQQGGP